MCNVACGPARMLQSPCGDQGLLIRHVPEFRASNLILKCAETQTELKLQNLWRWSLRLPPHAVFLHGTTLQLIKFAV